MYIQMYLKLVQGGNIFELLFYLLSFKPSSTWAIFCNTTTEGVVTTPPCDFEIYAHKVLLFTIIV